MSQTIMRQFRMKRVHTEIPDGFHKHQFPEVIKEEREKPFNIARGQRVKVTDGSYNFDAKTGKERHGIDDLFTNYATVIETNCERWVEDALDWIVQTDLLLIFENGTEIYCASNCVKLISK